MRPTVQYEARQDAWDQTCDQYERRPLQLPEAKWRNTCRENTLIILNSAVIIPNQLQRLANLSPSGCGIRNHAAGAHDLGQITAGNHRWGLIVDAALEAGRAPIHELNGALGLDRSNRCIHILWHHISLATNRPLPNKECGIRLGHENGKIFEAKRCHGKA